MWVCKKCSEEVEEQFEACWNCEADRSGRVPPPYSSLKNVEDAEAIAFLNEKHRSKNCLRCNINLKHIGTKGFHEGVNLGAAIGLAEVFVNETSLEMYVCPRCLGVEFFAADIRVIP